MSDERLPIRVIGWGFGAGGIPVWLGYDNAEGTVLRFKAGQVWPLQNAMPCPLAHFLLPVLESTADKRVTVDEYATATMAVLGYRTDTGLHEIWLIRHGLLGATITPIPILDPPTSPGSLVPDRILLSAGKILLLGMQGSNAVATVWDGAWGERRTVFNSMALPATTRDVQVGQGAFCVVNRFGDQLISHTWHGGSWSATPVTCPEETDIGRGVLAYSASLHRFGLVYLREPPEGDPTLFLRVRSTSAGAVWSAPRELERVPLDHRINEGMLKLVATPFGNRSGWAYCYSHGYTGLGTLKVVW